MENFTYEELRMIRMAVETEIIRREDKPLVNPERLAKFEDLYDKVHNLIQDQRAKENARTEAIEWQIGFCNADYSYDDLAYYEEYFEKMVKRYGLVKEFKENGII